MVTIPNELQWLEHEDHEYDKIGVAGTLPVGGQGGLDLSTFPQAWRMDGWLGFHDLTCYPAKFGGSGAMSCIAQLSTVRVL